MLFFDVPQPAENRRALRVRLELREYAVEVRSVALVLPMLLERPEVRFAFDFDGSSHRPNMIASGTWGHGAHRANAQSNRPLASRDVLAEHENRGLYENSAVAAGIGC